jgi:hypothetical protein
MLLRLLLQFRDISCLVQCRPGEELADDLLQCTPVQGVVVGDQDGEIGGGQCEIFFCYMAIVPVVVGRCKDQKGPVGVDAYGNEV